jgi:hypothetical protein
MIAILGLVVSSPANNVDASKGHDNCFQQGKVDGKDHPFNQAIHSVLAVLHTR